MQDLTRELAINLLFNLRKQGTSLRKRGSIEALSHVHAVDLNMSLCLCRNHIM